MPLMEHQIDGIAQNVKTVKPDKHTPTHLQQI